MSVHGDLGDLVLWHPAENGIIYAQGENSSLHKRERRQTVKKILMMIVTAAAMMLVTGCGEKKCFFVSQDGKLLKPGAPVVWYDAYVGKVDALEDADGGTKVMVKFGKKYDDQIHDGVAGRIVNDTKISPNAFVLLVGGRDGNRPSLESGAQIPESKSDKVVAEGFGAFFDWLKNSRADDLKILGVVLFALLAVIKFVSRLIKLAIFLGIIVAIGYVCVTANIGWHDYKDKFVNMKETAQEAKAWLQQHGEKLHTILENALHTDD